MNVSSKAILSKMEAEITNAKHNHSNRESLLRNVANIKVLCELLLDESIEVADNISRAAPTVEEVEKMMGRTANVEAEENVSHNPKSIFDF